MTSKQFKTYIKACGHDSIKITPQLIAKWWYVFNDLIFDGFLNKFPPHVDIRERNDEDDAIAWVIWSDDECTLGFDCFQINDVKMFCAILVHEMAHIENSLKYPHYITCHNPKFLQWKDTVESRLNLPFGITYGPQDFKI